MIELDDLVGIPFVKNSSTLEGADCYGLVRLYFKSLGIEIPSFDIGTDEHLKIHKNFMREIKSRWVFSAEPQKNAVVAMALNMKHRQTIQHFAVALGNGYMLHTLEKEGSHIVEINNYAYYIKGFYQWQN